MASPWDVDLSDPWSVDLSTEDDDAEWETRGAVQVNRKTGKTRPTPKFQGAAPGLGANVDPYEHSIAPGIGQLAARIKEGIATAPEFAATLVQKFLPTGVGTIPGTEVYGHGMAREVRDSVERDYQRKKDELAQHYAATGQSPAGSATTDTVLEGVAQVLDPTNYFPTKKAVQGVRGAAGLLDEGAEAGVKVLAKMEPLSAGKDRDLLARVLSSDEGLVSPGFGDRYDAGRFTAWLEKNGVDPAAAEAGGEVPRLAKEFFDLHNPKPSGRVSWEAVDSPAEPAPPGFEVNLFGKKFTVGGGKDAPAPRLRETDPQIFGEAPKAGKPLLAAEPNPGFEYSLDRLDVDEAMKPELNRVLREELGDKLPAAGGGTIPGLQGKLADPKVIDSLALKLGLTPEELAKKRPGYVLDTSGAAILDSALSSTTTKLEALVRDVAAGKVAPADLAAANETIAQLRYKRNTLVIASSGTASEQGRALGARRFKIPGLSDEDALRAAINRKYQLTPEQMDGLAKLDPSRPEDVNAFLRGVDKPGVGGMVTSLWRASIMSGIPTQLRNVLGNTTQLAWEMGTRPIAAGIEQGGLAKMAGRAPAARVQDTVPAFIGAYDGAKAGFGKAWAALKTGMTPEAAGKFDLARMNSFELVENPVLRTLGKAATEPVYRTLSAVDTFFRTIGWTSKQYETAARLASQEGKPLAEMMTDPRVLEEAEKFARRITYTDEPSKFAQGVAKAAKGLDEMTGIPIGTFAVPFTSVPDRVMARAFEATPAGLMRAAWKAAKKDPAAADGLAKGALGTAVAYWAYGQAKDGLMTAGVPADSAERAQFYELGAQPWSMKVGDKWVPYSQMGPLGFTMAMSAQIAEYNSQTGDDEGVPDKLLSAGLGAANYVLDQSYVDNLQKLTEMVGSNDNLDTRRKKLSRFVNQTAAGFVPYSALQRNIAQATDQRVTDPQGLLQTIEANTPGLSQNVPAKLTPWGEEVTRQETPLGAFLPRNTPLYGLAQKEKPVDPVEAELARLGIAAPFVGKTLDATARRPKRPLSEDEWRAYQTDAGQAAHARLEQVISLPGWNLLRDDVKVKRLKQILELERKRSRLKLFGP